MNALAKNAALGTNRTAVLTLLGQLCRCMPLANMDEEVSTVEQAVSEC